MKNAMPPLLLLTRPEHAARRFADEAAHLGLEVLISPVLRIVPLDHDRVRLAGARGLVFTSENAVRFAGPGQGRPAICVGPRSARVAQEAGFDAVAGPGDAARLEPMLRDLGPGWLHPHGRHIAKRLPVPGMAVYDQVAQPLSDAALAALAGTRPIALPLFSPRTARILSAQMAGVTAPLWLVAISAAAEQAWRGDIGRDHIARLAVAPTPDAPGTLRGLAEVLCQA